MTGTNVRNRAALAPLSDTSIVALPAGAGRSGRAGGQSPGRVERRAGSASISDESPAPGGLVPYAITVRDHEELPDWSADGLWRPAFPGPELVEAAADLLPSIQEPSGHTATLSEGPRWEVVVSPGVIRVRARDYARAERASERRGAHHRAEVDMVATFLAGGKDVPELLPTRGTIVAWSPKSRARLVARLSDLDYTRLYGRYRTCADCGNDYDAQLEHCPACGSPHSVLIDRSHRLPAMITLTYPGDWVTVAPTAGSVKRHLWALYKRYARAWGEQLIGPWKLEFQARGAPQHRSIGRYSSFATPLSSSDCE